MYIVTHRKFFFAITGALFAIAVGAIAILGLPLSIDFTGGSLVEVEYTTERPAVEELTHNVEQLALGAISLRESGETGVILRTRTLTPAEHDQVLRALGTQARSTTTVATSTTATSTVAATGAEFTELRFNSIGPALGSELAKKALYALGAVTLAIMLYIAWAFRRVSRPVSAWVYGGIVVVILIHDVIVPAGFYAILAHFTGSQVDALFAVALLAILGYSVNDTIVIFDRVREHLHTNEERKVVEPFEETVGKSVTETLGRSINTSLTVALALLALVFFGSDETVHFALVLLIGVIAGTYSSILLAAPLLLPLAERFAEKPHAGKKK
jgi:preprotein translocase subunit SecF